MKKKGKNLKSTKTKYNSSLVTHYYMNEQQKYFVSGRINAKAQVKLFLIFYMVMYTVDVLRVFCG